MSVQYTVEDCESCPLLRVVSTPHTGFGQDWWCIHEDHIDPEIKWSDLASFHWKLIVGYVEYPSEMPKEIPDWCPLREKNVSPISD